VKGSEPDSSDPTLQKHRHLSAVTLQRTQASAGFSLRSDSVSFCGHLPHQHECYSCGSTSFESQNAAGDAYPRMTDKDRRIPGVGPDTVGDVGPDTGAVIANVGCGGLTTQRRVDVKRYISKPNWTTLQDVQFGLPTASSRSGVQAGAYICRQQGRKAVPSLTAVSSCGHGRAHVVAWLLLWRISMHHS